MTKRLLKWTSEDLTTDDTIDKQNQTLILATNKLINSGNEDHLTENILKDFISLLSDHATYCFGHEDSLLITLEFENKSIHLEEHNAFIEKITHYKNLTSEPTTVDALIKSIRTWQKNHIRIHDKLLAEKLLIHSQNHS